MNSCEMSSSFLLVLKATPCRLFLMTKLFEPTWFATDLRSYVTEGRATNFMGCSPCVTSRRFAHTVSFQCHGSHSLEEGLGLGDTAYPTTKSAAGPRCHRPPVPAWLGLSPLRVPVDSVILGPWGPVQGLAHCMRYVNDSQWQNIRITCRADCVYGRHGHLPHPCGSGCHPPVCVRTCVTTCVTHSRPSPLREF